MGDTSYLQPAQPVTVNGVEYPSMWAAEKATGISRAAISKVKQRHGIEAVKDHKFVNRPSTKRVRVEDNGKVYPSIRAWAKAKGYSMSGAHYRAYSSPGVRLHRDQ